MKPVLGPRPRTVVAFVLAIFVVGLVAAGVAAARERDDTTAFSSEERAAMSAASVTAANLLSYRRASFDADYARALDGTTGDLHADIEGMKDETLSTLTTNRFDLAAEVTDVALEPVANGPLKVLVVVKGSTVDDAGNTTLAKLERVELTMVDRDDRWLASDLRTPDGVSPSHDDERARAVAAAGSCLASMNSYDYRSLGEARAAGIACTADSFTPTYTKSFDAQIAALAPAAQASQSFEADGAGLKSMSSDGKRADVLVVGQLTTTNTNTGGAPQYAVLSAVVKMEKVGDDWKVAGYRTSP